jgi:hypothetical protein
MQHLMPFMFLTLRLKDLWWSGAATGLPLPMRAHLTTDPFYYELFPNAGGTNQPFRHGLLKTRFTSTISTMPLTRYAILNFSTTTLLKRQMVAPTVTHLLAQILFT